MKTSEMLDKAADLIERGGHWRGGDGRQPEQHCALTALGQCSYEMAEVYEAMECVKRAAGCEYIAEWSDSSPTKHVTSTLRACAMTERAREARMLPAVRETVPA